MKGFRHNSWSHAGSQAIRLPITRGSDTPLHHTLGTNSPSTQIYTISPIVPSTTTTPPLFLTELPEFLYPFIPAPTHRSHILELNKILSSSHAARARRYVILKFAYLFLLIMLSLTSLSLIALSPHLNIGLLLIFTVIALSLIFPVIRRVWFTAFIGTVQQEIQSAVSEWNARGIPGIKWRVIAAGNFFIPGQNFGFQEFSADLEFQVLIDTSLFRARQAAGKCSLSGAVAGGDLRIPMYISDEAVNFGVE